MSSSLAQRKLIDPLIALLRQGNTPQKLALSLACGILIGVFPVLGASTALCALVALIFRLNLPAIQIANYAVYPAQLALLLPFIRAGQWILHAQQTNMPLSQIVQIAKTDQVRAFHLLWRMTLQGMVAWVIFAAIALPVLYWLLFKALERIQREIQVRRASAERAEA